MPGAMVAEGLGLCLMLLTYTESRCQISLSARVNVKD